MNEHRTRTNLDTPVTQRRSRPVLGPLRFKIIDPTGQEHGPFDNTEAMSDYIERHFSPLPITFDGDGYDLERVTDDLPAASRASHCS